MGFTRSTTNTEVHQNMPDYPSGEGYTTTQLKAAFDAPATGLKDDLNNLEAELETTSAASSVGASPISESDASDATVQAKLEKIYGEMQNIALGDIPDNTITETKLNTSFNATIAKKDGNLQTGLNSEKFNGKTEQEFKDTTAAQIAQQTFTATVSKPSEYTYKWADMGKGNPVTMTLPGNSRFYIVKVIGTTKRNTNYYYNRHTFILDAQEKTMDSLTLTSPRAFEIDGVDLTLTPKFYFVSSTSNFTSGLRVSSSVSSAWSHPSASAEGIAFTQLNNNVLTMIPAIYDYNSESSYNVTFSFKVEICELLTKAVN